MGLSPQGDVKVKTSKLVTLFVLTMIMSVVSVSAGDRQDDPVVICHKPGTPAEGTRVVDRSALNKHLRHGDYEGECDPGNGEDPGNGGDPGNGVDSSNSVPYQPTLIQLTVWPDTYQLMNVSGIVWAKNGSLIYDDLNGNGMRDLDEQVIITPMEYRNRVVESNGIVVENQAMSRLVLGMTYDDINSDKATVLAQFSAYLVVDGNLFPVEGAWFDINGEFPPHADGTGFSEYRPAS